MPRWLGSVPRESQTAFRKRLGERDGREGAYRRLETRVNGEESGALHREVGERRLARAEKCRGTGPFKPARWRCSTLPGRTARGKAAPSGFIPSVPGQAPFRFTAKILLLSRATEPCDTTKFIASPFQKASSTSTTETPVFVELQEMAKARRCRAKMTKCSVREATLDGSGCGPVSAGEGHAAVRCR